MKYTKLSKEIDEKIAQLYVDGASINSLCPLFSCSSDSIRRALRRQGVTMRPRGNSYKILEQSQVDTIIAGYEGGLSQADIAEKMGVGQVQISRILRRNNVHIRGGSMVGKDNPNWKGGKTITDQGYILVNPLGRFPTMQNRMGYIPEHRFVMAQYMERPLYDWETVHHIDGNKQNNKLENLQLRIGKHGKHEAYVCTDCGSTRIEPTKLEGEYMADKKKKPIYAVMTAGLQGRSKVN